MTLVMMRNENRMTSLTIRVPRRIKEQLLHRARVQARRTRRSVKISEVARDLLGLALEVTEAPDTELGGFIQRVQGSSAEEMISAALDELAVDGVFVELHEHAGRAFSAVLKAFGFGLEATTARPQASFRLVAGVVGLGFAELLRRGSRGLLPRVTGSDHGGQSCEAPIEPECVDVGASESGERAHSRNRADTDVDGPDWLQSAPGLGE